MKKTVSFFAAVLLAGSTMFAQAPQREEVAKQIDEYVQQVIDTWKIPGMAST